MFLAIFRDTIRKCNAFFAKCYKQIELCNNKIWQDKIKVVPLQQKKQRVNKDMIVSFRHVCV